MRSPLSRRPARPQQLSAQVGHEARPLTEMQPPKRWSAWALQSVCPQERKHQPRPQQFRTSTTATRGVFMAESSSTTSGWPQQLHVSLDPIKGYTTHAMQLAAQGSSRRKA